MGVALREREALLRLLFYREMVREAVHRLPASLAAFGVEMETRETMLDDTDESSILFGEMTIKAD